jgi:hypothetical protein
MLPTSLLLSFRSLLRLASFPLFKGVIFLAVYSVDLEFQVLTAEIVKKIVFWDVMLWAPGPVHIDGIVSTLCYVKT